jgi:ubiquinone/menaquinone biosynthesis C-methylase UbiE
MLKARPRTVLAVLGRVLARRVGLRPKDQVRSVSLRRAATSCGQEQIMGAMEFDSGIRTYYDKGQEASRLASGAGRLELERTQELIARSLTESALDVLDVGGGPGAYASWLSKKGHRVHVVDPIPLHVEQATTAGLSAEIGDARELNQADNSVDAVLLLGPLYHLPDSADRSAALSEAMRVLRPGGLVLAAAISRHAALLDLLVNWDKLHDPGVFELVEESVRTGVFGGPGEAGLFTTSYFHLPSELKSEVAEAGFTDVHVFHVEGPGFLVPDLEARLDDPPRREALLRAIRLVEEDPAFLGSSHLLAVGRTPTR